MKVLLTVGLFLTLPWGVALQAQYSTAFSDNGNSLDAPVPGFSGPQGDGFVPLELGDANISNPVFLNWADTVVDYSPAPGVDGFFQFASEALGPATGDELAVVSLGDLSAEQIANSDAPGTLTLSFNESIYDAPGADFVVFENGHLSLTNEGGAGVGGIWGELAFVEVSSDGVNFARFDGISNTQSAVGPYGTLNPMRLYNFAGKHLNSNGQSWGTPFDLAQLANHPLVTVGKVDLSAIRYIRLVDIPGSGAYLDSQGNPIFDGWLTFGSGGADIDAVGAISQALTYAEWDSGRNLDPADNSDGDPWPNWLEYAFGFDPSSPEDAAAVRVELGPDAQVFCFPWESRVVDCTLVVEMSTNLVDWETVAVLGPMGNVELEEVVLGLESTSRHAQASLGVKQSLQLQLPLTDGPCFFRIRVPSIPN